MLFDNLSEDFRRQKFFLGFHIAEFSSVTVALGVNLPPFASFIFQDVLGKHKLDLVCRGLVRVHQLDVIKVFNFYLFSVYLFFASITITVAVVLHARIYGSH